MVYYGEVLGSKEKILAHNETALKAIMEGNVDVRLINPTPLAPREGGRFDIREKKLVTASVEDRSFSNLPEDLQDVLIGLFFTEPPMSLAQIGVSHGKSRETIRKQKIKALEMLSDKK